MAIILIVKIEIRRYNDIGAVTSEDVAHAELRNICTFNIDGIDAGLITLFRNYVLKKYIPYVCRKPEFDPMHGDLL